MSKFHPACLFEPLFRTFNTQRSDFNPPSFHLRPALPKLSMVKAPLAASNPNAMPGTPQPSDPAMVLKKNLKRRVDVRLDKKIAEVPKNSSPYTLTVRDSGSGSPVEEFVKLNDKKIGKENVTGTPARLPAAGNKRSKILQPLENRSSRRKNLTPKKLKTDTPKAKDILDLENSENLNSPVLETGNKAVNRIMAKTLNSTNLNNENGGNETAAASGGNQIVTGDLASLCAIM